jgi:hypothetical protein
MQQVVVFAYQYAASWRLYTKNMHMEDIFEEIINTSDLSMKRQWAAMLYLRHRNGVNGSKIFRDLLKQGIRFPTNSEEAEKYFKKYLEGKTWQGTRFGNPERALRDFKMVVRQTMNSQRFLGRFEKNMAELETVDIDQFLNSD